MKDDFGSFTEITSSSSQVVDSGKIKVKHQENAVKCFTGSFLPVKGNKRFRIMFSSFSYDKFSHCFMYDIR